MKAGDLVKWSQLWLDGCGNATKVTEPVEVYQAQIGVILYRVSDPRHCYRVLWCDKDIVDVHYDYLEVLCE